MVWWFLVFTVKGLVQKHQKGDQLKLVFNVYSVMCHFVRHVLMLSIGMMIDAFFFTLIIEPNIRSHRKQVVFRLYTLHLFIFWSNLFGIFSFAWPLCRVCLAAVLVFIFSCKPCLHFDIFSLDLTFGLDLVWHQLAAIYFILNLYFGPICLASFWNFLICSIVTFVSRMFGCGLVFSSVSLAYIFTYFPWFWHMDLIFFGINWLPFIFIWIWIKIVWKPDDSVRLIFLRYETTFAWCVFYTLLCTLKISFTFAHLVSICCKRNLYQD